MNIRVRFAPSPTGYLHVGGTRTALFNWLYARHEGGKFLLRIEDTDKARSTDEHRQVILDGLSWLGLDWDEELVFQGARVKRHQEIADRLLTEGKAYLDEGAIRFRVPPGEIAWEDAVHGRISFQGADIKDFIILRSDRTPIYNLAVVVDDLDMRITHVLRGDDHISNTPKQIALYQALDAPLPVFGHVPMINGPDGKKLSKRHGATAVGDYQHMGILPAAMRNFLALLGWSPGGDREIMTLDEMIQLFSFAGIQQKAAIFDMTKLEWMNGQYLSMTPAEQLLPLVAPQLETLGVNGNKEAVLKAIAAVKTRSRTTLDVARQVAARLLPPRRAAPRPALGVPLGLLPRPQVAHVLLEEPQRLSTPGRLHQVVPHLVQLACPHLLAVVPLRQADRQQRERRRGNLDPRHVDELRADPEHLAGHVRGPDGALPRALILIDQHVERVDHGAQPPHHRGVPILLGLVQHVGDVGRQRGARQHPQPTVAHLGQVHDVGSDGDGARGERRVGPADRGPGGPHGVGRRRARHRPSQPAARPPAPAAAAERRQLGRLRPGGRNDRDQALRPVDPARPAERH